MTSMQKGFPGDSVVKNLCANVGAWEMWVQSWIGKIPGG